MPSPITLSGSTPATNATGITISAAATDVTNNYTQGANFTFTNAGALIDSYAQISGQGAAIYVVAGNNTQGMPVNLITNTGSINAYGFGTRVIAQSGQTDPVLINNTGTIRATDTQANGAGIYTGPNVAASVTNSGEISGPAGLSMLGEFSGTEVAINLAGGTIAATDLTAGDYGVRLQSNAGGLQGTGILVNYGLIAGVADDSELNTTIINAGTITGVVFSEGAGTLVLGPGSALEAGAVFADQNSAETNDGQPLSTLLLTGTLGALGTLSAPAGYDGFGALTVATGADWAIGSVGASSAIANISTFQVAGTLNVAGQLPGTVLDITGSAQVASGLITAAIVESGGNLLAASGGTASATQVLYGGVETISGLTALGSGSVIATGGTEIIAAGAIENAGTVLSGGTLVAHSGGIASGAVVQSGGTLAVASGGLGIAAQVQSGGVETISRGGLTGTALASGSVISAGGTETIAAGGVENAGTAQSGGTIAVQSGGLASGAVVQSGGTLAVVSGGISVSALVQPGALESISGNGISGSALGDGSVVASGGSEQLAAGGIETSGIVQSGGTLAVGSGGIARAAQVQSGGLAMISGTGISGTAFGSGDVISSGGSETIAAGGIETSGSVQNGGTITLLSGGVAASVAVQSGGTLAVTSGGTARAAQVQSGGLETISGNGASGTALASGSVISNGGTEVLSAGGIEISGTVQNGGTLAVGSGGTASAALVQAGGLEILSGNGVSGSALGAGSVIEGGGTESISEGAIETGGTAQTGGTIAVNAGGVVASTFIQSGGTLLVASGGAADNVINLGGSELISAGGSYTTPIGTELAVGGTVAAYYAAVGLGGEIIGNTVTGAGVLYVDADGEALGETVIAGGQLILDNEDNGAGAAAGGTIANAIIASGGVLLLSAGTAFNTTVGSGGSASIGGFGATAAVILSGGLVASGGTETVGFGAQLSGQTIAAGGTLHVAAGASVSGLVVQLGATIALTADYSVASGVTSALGSATNRLAITSGTTEFVGSGGSATAARIEAGGTLNASIGSTLINTDFLGSGGTLTLAGLMPSAGTIAGFAAGDVINLTSLAEVTGGSISVSGNLVTITEGTASVALDITGAAGDAFHLASVSGGSVELTIPATPCFMAGTLIRTERGEVQVQDLRIGDHVITQSGAAVPVKWIGRRAYRQPYPANSVDIIPILICRNALGPGLPRRDLYVSPLHAMYLADVLVPAGLLVNGRSIRACPHLPEVRYFHIELPRHDLIFAEGAATESFVDCNSREMFENAAEFAALYPGEAPEAWRFCAPRVESGPTLRRIWQLLAGRAGLTSSPGAVPHARLLGYIDHAEHHKITGWAYLPDHPGEAVELEVLDGEGVIARLIADKYRADLVQAGIGNGRHGFELTFAEGLALDRSHTISVRRAGAGPELSRSPISLKAPKPLPQAAQPHALKRALVLDAHWPDPTRDAGSNAILSHIAGLLALGFAVDLMAVQEPGMAPPGLSAHSIGTPDFSSVEALLRARGRDYALIYLHRLAVAGPYAGLVRNLSRAFVIYSVADLHHHRLAGQARIEQDSRLAEQARAAALEEFLAMRQADAVITHTAQETAYLRASCPGINAHTVPWHAPVAANVTPFARRHGLVFVGNYRHAPNLDAVRWLLDEIMPLVWAKNPRITCRIAGALWPASALPVLDPRVTLTGYVPDRDALFGTARLSVAPLRFGAGLKGKVLDSLAAGIPCAMTPLAAEGFGLEGALGGLVADSAAELAGLICRLHDRSGFNAAMGRAGQTLVAERFGEANVLGALRAVLEPEQSKESKESGRFFEKNSPRLGLRKKLLPA